MLLLRLEEILQCTIEDKALEECAEEGRIVDFLPLQFIRSAQPTALLWSGQCNETL